MAARSAERSRVNRDDIRYANFGAYELEPAQEKTVTQIEHATLRALLAAGRSVVVDNQNLREEPVLDYMAIAAEYGATVLFRDFSVELKEALRRNAQREVNPLPTDRLRQLYERFFRTGGFPAQPVLTPIEPYTPEPELPSAWLFDIDGTLAHFGRHRGPFDWAKLLDDEPDEHVVALAQLVAAAGHRIIILSGRSDVDNVREDTLVWLAAHGVPVDAFFLRGGEDARSDAVVKREIFEREIRDFYNVRGVVDDRLQVARMWHQLGLPLFRVGSPDAIY